MDNHSKEIDNEDRLPISSLVKNKAFGRVLDKDMEDNVDTRAGDVGNKNGEDNGKSIIETNLKIDNVLVDSKTQKEVKLSDNMISGPL